MTTLTGIVQTFEKLPATPSVGDLYKVTGGAETQFISYYVQYSSDAVWDETVAPDLENVIDPTTMPHALIRQADGSFLFTPFTWDNRKVGDDDTNPKPGFIGRSINGVFFYQNRLAFLYDEKTIMSCSGQFGDFWRTTVLDYIDSDVVEFAASSNQVSILRDAVPFNNGIMLFADQTQFSMTNGENGVSPSSVAIRPVTHYEVEPGASPVVINSEVYFASGQATHSIIYEYTHATSSDATAAANITAHVPRYIPTGTRQIIPAADQNALFVLTAGAPHSVFVYQFYWLNEQAKAQSAWHRWDFPQDVTVMSGTYVDGFLYLVLSRDTGIHLEKLQLEANVAPSGSPTQLYMDSRAFITGVYDGVGHTTFTLPYEVSHTENFQIVRGSEYGDDALKLIPNKSLWAWSGLNTVTVPGDYSLHCFVGYTFEFRYRFSRPYLRRGDNTSVTSGRLQLRTLTVEFKDTTNFRWEVWPYGLNQGSPVTGYYTGWELGDFVPGSSEFQKGRHPIQVYSNAETGVVDLVNDSIFGCSFQSAEWETFYWNRSRG